MVLLADEGEDQVDEAEHGVVEEADGAGWGDHRVVAVTLTCVGGTLSNSLML